jgi:ribosome-binding factor A
MQGRRVDRIEEQLRMELSEILGREIQDPRVHLVTVTHVKVSPDLRHAWVSISSLGGPEERKKTLQGLRSAASYARRALGARLHHLRRVPELTFDYDDTLDKERRLEELLDEIGKSESSGDASDGRDSHRR